MNLAAALAMLIDDLNFWLQDENVFTACLAGAVEGVVAGETAAPVEPLVFNLVS